MVLVSATEVAIHTMVVMGDIQDMVDMVATIHRTATIVSQRASLAALEMPFRLIS